VALSETPNLRDEKQRESNFEERRDHEKARGRSEKHKCNAQNSSLNVDSAASYIICMLFMDILFDEENVPYLYHKRKAKWEKTCDKIDYKKDFHKIDVNLLEDRV